MFDALEWLAATRSHVLTKGEKMIRYDGYNSMVRTGNCWGMTPEMNGNLSIPSKAAPDGIQVLFTITIPIVSNWKTEVDSSLPNAIRNKSCFF